MKSATIRGRKAPSFAKTYLLKTIFKQDGPNHTWYGYQVGEGTWVRDKMTMELGAASFVAMQERPIKINMGDLGTGENTEDPSGGASGTQRSTVDPATVI